MKGMIWQRIKKVIGAAALALALAMPMTVAAPQPAAAQMIVFDPVAVGKNIVEFAQQAIRFALTQGQWILENIQRAFHAVSGVLQGLIGQEADSAREDAAAGHARATEMGGTVGAQLAEYAPNTLSRTCQTRLLGQASHAGGALARSGAIASARSGVDAEGRKPEDGPTGTKQMTWDYMFACRAGFRRQPSDMSPEVFTKLNCVTDGEEGLDQNVAGIFQKYLCLQRPTQTKLNAILTSRDGAAAAQKFRDLSPEQQRYVLAILWRKNVIGPTAAMPNNSTLSPADISAGAVNSRVRLKKNGVSFTIDLAIGLKTSYENPSETPAAESLQTLREGINELIEDHKLNEPPYDPEIKEFAEGKPLCMYAINEIKALTFESETTMEELGSMPTADQLPARAELVQAAATTRRPNEEAMDGVQRVALTTIGSGAEPSIEGDRALLDDKTMMSPRQVAEMTGEPVAVVEARFKKWDEKRLTEIAKRAKEKREAAQDGKDGTPTASTVTPVPGKQSSVTGGLLRLSGQ